jgi:hypothetical protein
MGDFDGFVYSSPRRVGRSARELEWLFGEHVNPKEAQLTTALVEEQSAIRETHFLEKPILDFLDDLSEDLKIIDYSIEFGGERQGVEELLTRKIKERLQEHFYDSLPAEVETMMGYIVLKPWPPEWNAPEGSLYVNGKVSRFLILLRLEITRLTPEQRMTKQEKIRKVEYDKQSKQNIRNISRYHSRRK